MALFTNMSTRLICLPDGVNMLPGMPVEVSGEVADNEQFQDLVELGDIKAGEAPPPEEMAKIQEDRAQKQQEALERLQQPIDQQPPEEQQRRQAPPPVQAQVTRTTTATVTKSS